MKIRALQSGKFAHPEPGRGFITLREDREYAVDDKMARSLIECGWGAESAAVSGDLVGLQEPEDKPLNKMNKSELIAYAKERDVPLDPELTNADMRVAISWAESDSDDE